MNLRLAVKLHVLLVSLLLLSGCAAPGIKSELDQEMDQLNRHLPSE
jgi:Tfp pilus assembly protein PilP